MRRETAGLLVERVTVEQRQEARDALGGSAETWTVLADMWAGVAPDRKGTETSGGALRGERRWAVTLRRRDGLNLSCRLIWGTRVLRVRSVDDDPRVNEVVTLRCEEQPCSSC